MDTEMDGQLQTYVLTRLDEVRTTLADSHSKLDTLTDLVRALPVTGETMSPSFVSRLEKWLPWLQRAGTAAVKHLTAAATLWYIWQGGDALKAADTLLKLL
jgi:hypothetical protein